MTPEELDSLLLDRALGELPPAVAALLEVHLARDPAAAARAADLNNTVQLARRASLPAAATPAVPRPLDLARLRQIEALESAARRRSEFYRLAASLTVGLGFGWLLRPAPSPEIPGSILPSPTLVAAPPDEPHTKFWSLRRHAGIPSPRPTGGAIPRPPAR